MKKLLEILIIVLFFNNVAFSFTAKGTLAMDCGSFWSAFKGPDKYILDLYTQGISGFITGLNYSNNTRVGYNADAKMLTSIALDYCNKNPMKNVFDAALYTYEEGLK